jgi:hypothetical protein
MISGSASGRLLHCHLHEAPPAGHLADDVLSSGALQDFRVDRTDGAAFEPIGAPGQVNARPLLARQVPQLGFQLGEQCFNIAGLALAAFFLPKNHAQHPECRRRGVGAAIDQDVGAHLLLDRVGQRDVGAAHRPEIDDVVGLLADDGFQVRGPAASRQPPDLGEVSVGLRDIGHLAP